jgi:hypothetical protein
MMGSTLNVFVGIVEKIALCWRFSKTLLGLSRDKLKILSYPLKLSHSKGFNILNKQSFRQRV